MQEFKARVINILLNEYICLTEDNRVVTCILSGNMKKNKVNVGDIVKIDERADKFIITNVVDRRNIIIRPAVSNISQMILCVSVSHPLPDYLLLDKQIVFCLSNGIKPVICINKIDLATKDEEAKKNLEYIEKAYPKIGIKIIKISAKENINLNEIRDILKDNISAFSGNSGVR